MAALTKKQRALKADIEDISSLIGMDHWDILSYLPKARTPRLNVIRAQLIRGHIITKYTLIDEFLSAIIVNYFFRKPKKTPHYGQLWRTKKFQVFNYFILDETYVLQKVRLVDGIQKVPPSIRNAMERINAVRNAIAHSFFPENRRQYRSHKKVAYQGADIFTKAGVEAFEQDFEIVSEYLWKRAGWA